MVTPTMSITSSASFRKETTGSQLGYTGDHIEDGEITLSATAPSLGNLPIYRREDTKGKVINTARLHSCFSI